MDDNKAKQVTGAWRTSSFSDGGACVEVAPAADDQVAIRNSRDHSQGILLLPRPVMNALVAGAKAGEFDDLA